MKAALKNLLALALLALGSALPTEAGLQHTLDNLERDLDDINYAVVSHEQIHDLERRAGKHSMTDLASTGLMSHCVPDEDAGVEMTEMVTPKSPDPRKRRSNPFDTEDEESDLWDEDEGTRV